MNVWLTYTYLQLMPLIWLSELGSPELRRYYAYTDFPVYHKGSPRKQGHLHFFALSILDENTLAMRIWFLPAMYMYTWAYTKIYTTNYNFPFIHVHPHTHFFLFFLFFLINIINEMKHITKPFQIRNANFRMLLEPKEITPSFLVCHADYIMLTHNRLTA